MNKNTITYGILGLVLGLVLGFIGANFLNRDAARTTPEATETVKAPPSAPGDGDKAGKPLADVQKVLDKAKNEPDNADAQIDAGEMYVKIQRFEKAIEYFKRAQKVKPEDLATNVKLGNVYFDAKQFEKAESFYAKAIEISPNDPAIRTDYGLTFYLREPNDLKRAIIEFRKSLAIDPNHEITLQNLSAALKDNGDEADLAKTLTKLKEVNPNNPVITKLEGGKK